MGFTLKRIIGRCLMKIMILRNGRAPAEPLCTIMFLGGCTANAGRLSTQETHMWTKPEYTEMRFGFEVTMYIASR